MSVPTLRFPCAMRRGSIALLVLGFALGFAQTAVAATYVVNSTADRVDIAPGNGVCATGTLVFDGSGLVNECTLRAAIEEANQDVAADRVEFSPILPVDSQGTIVIAPASRLPSIERPLVIDGTTAPGYVVGDVATVPVVTLDGSGVVDVLNLSPGLRLNENADSSQILALAIVGFPGSGIAVLGADGARIDRCHIGVYRGDSVNGNAVDGIEVSSTALATIIGQRFDDFSGFEGAGNVIAGNQRMGVFVIGDGTFIAGNRIGTDRFGASVTPPLSTSHANGSWGIQFAGNATFNFAGVKGTPIVTGVEEAAGNVIAGNFDGGILFGSVADGNFVYANHIGVDAAGLVALGNAGKPGIEVLASDTTIGEVGVGGNVIGGHVALVGDTAGILVGRTGAFDPSGVVIAGNRIGVGSDDVTPVPNDRGIDIDEATGASIEDNVVGENDTGMWLEGHSTTLLRNFIGTNPGGGDVGNVGDGVIARGFTIIGDPIVSGGGNRIGFNGDDGVDVDTGADGTILTGNEIGATAAGVLMGNGGAGVEVHAQNTDVGFVGAGTPNVIGGNQDGVRIRPLSSATNVRRNYIGTNATGADLGNANAGVAADGTDAVIGSDSDAGVADLAPNANVIAFSGADGVQVTSASAAVAIRANSIHSNAGIAIDLADDGSTPNDPGDGDAGPNTLQNHPTIEMANWNAGTGRVEVRYRIDSDLALVSYPLDFDVYLADASGQPEIFLGTDELLSSEAGTAKDVSFVPPTTPIGGERLVAIATSGTADSSEVSAPVVLLPEPGGWLGLALGAAATLALRRPRWRP